MARKLLWETEDHWQSIDDYKRYLPRLLQVMGPPEFEEDLYPSHLLEVLNAMGFSSWCKKEKDAVFSYLNLVTPFIYGYDMEDSLEWTTVMESLEKQVCTAS